MGFQEIDLALSPAKVLDNQRVDDCEDEYKKITLSLRFLGH